MQQPTAKYRTPDLQIMSRSEPAPVEQKASQRPKKDEAFSASTKGSFGRGFQLQSNHESWTFDRNAGPLWVKSCLGRSEIPLPLCSGERMEAGRRWTSVKCRYCCKSRNSNNPETSRKSIFVHLRCCFAFQCHYVRP